MSKSKDQIRELIDGVIDYYVSPDGLGRSEPPMKWNDRAVADHFAYGLQDGESLESTLAHIRTFDEWKRKHKGETPSPPNPQ